MSGRTAPDAEGADVPPHSAELCLPDAADRDDLGVFVARVVRFDQAALVRLRAVRAWVLAVAPTPFDVLVSRAVPGELTPADLTVTATDLLAALAVDRAKRIVPGRPMDRQWLRELPPTGGWRAVDEIPAAELTALAEQHVALASPHTGPHRDLPTGLLDQTVLTAAGNGMQVRVPLRCLFALSGMGFPGPDSARAPVRISATDSWVRLDASFGTVLCRRYALLPLAW